MPGSVLLSLSDGIPTAERGILTSGLGVPVCDKASASASDLGHYWVPDETSHDVDGAREACDALLA